MKANAMIRSLLIAVCFALGMILSCARADYVTVLPGSSETVPGLTVDSSGRLAMPAQMASSTAFR